jgi:acetylglutamate kinase
MKARGLTPRFVHGHRVTDADTLAIARDVLANQINADICSRLARAGGRPAAVADGSDGVLRAQRRLARVRTADGRTEEVDLGLVGDIVAVDVERFLELTRRDFIPVVAPLATGDDGEVLNVNADMVAGFLAGALKAEKAVFLSDTHGILTDPKDAQSFAPTLTEAQVRDLIHKGVIDGGMLPKVEACIVALDGGVRKAHIIDGRIKHSLLLEIFTDAGVGTQVLR